jgi:hypothetical protein
MSTPQGAIRNDIKTLKVPETKKGGLVFQRTEPGLPEKINALVYGVPGIGKTVFGATFPDPLFIDIDRGLMSVRHKRVAFIQPKTFADLKASMTPNNLTEFKSIILDSATELHPMIMGETLKAANREAAQQSDWGVVSERIIQFIKQLRELPQHVLIICEERVDRDEETGRVSIGPALPGQLFANVGRYVDMFFHMTVATKVVDGKNLKGRYLVTEPVGLNTQGKDRSWALDKIEDPDFNVIWGKMQKAVKV